MKPKTHILLIAGISLLAIVLQAPAQEEQWLQYHSAREIGLMGGVQHQSLDLSTEKPSGVELKGENCLFAKWSTPMVKSGHLWVALDRTHKQGPYDLLRLDSNGNGRLDDETVVTAYRRDQYSTYFGPVKIIFEVEDGPVTYHLNFRYFSGNDRDRRLYASSGGWYQGDIFLGGQKKHCILLDYNVNGTFNDTSANSAECDRIRIGEEGGQDTGLVGNYIEVGNILYRPDIARDGASIKLVRAEGVKFGSVRMSEGVTQLSVNGQNGSFTRKPKKGIASLPVGRYRIYDWIIDRKDDKGTEWRLQGGGTFETRVFDIAEGQEAVLSVGEPVIATLEASDNRGTHSFRHTLTGRDGERVELTRNGAQPQAPKVRIKSADGKYDRTYSFSYG